MPQNEYLFRVILCHDNAFRYASIGAHGVSGAFCLGSGLRAPETFTSELLQGCSTRFSNFLLSVMLCRVWMAAPLSIARLGIAVVSSLLNKPQCRSKCERTGILTTFNASVSPVLVSCFRIFDVTHLSETGD